MGQSIDIHLDENIHESLMPYLVNWNKVTSKITDIDNQILQTGNVTVESKLHYAFMHLEILKQAYQEGSFGRSLIKRAMTENVILNLVSSLEALDNLESFNSINQSVK